MDSPVTERRSRRIAPADLIVDDVPPEELNDDEEERNQLRIQEESNRKSNSMITKRISLAERSISDRNVSEHFQSCIQLAAENKITAKNAFNFKLIDLLYTMLKKKEQFNNFTEVTSSLDAGVKIYSCRVDNVHSDTMKMATSISVASHRPDEDNTAFVETNETDPTKRGKRKLNRKDKKLTIASNLDQIKRSLNVVEDGISQKILTNESLVINSALFDINFACWHLNTNANFWSSFEPHPLNNSSVPIDFLEICTEAMICQTYDHFQFGDEAISQAAFEKEDIFNAFEYEPPAENTCTFDNDQQAMADDCDITQQTDEDKVPEMQYFSRIMSSSAFVNDISKLISAETSEYLYFNSQALNKSWSLKNMRHWNPFKKKKDAEEKRPRFEKREKIDFQDFSGFDVYNSEHNAATTTNISAPREKFLITPITHFSLHEFFRLKIWREMFVIPSKNLHEDQPSDLDETINDYNYNNPNDSQNFVPEQYEDDYCDDPENDAASDIHEAIEKNAFIGDNLIEIPNKVSKIQLPYMVKDKSVNMKKLKNRIWSKLETPSKNILSSTDPDSISFTGVCQVLLVDEKKSSDEELTVPILFNAILQLANDKCLYLFNPTESDVTDFMVTVSNSAK